MRKKLMIGSVTNVRLNTFPLRLIIAGVGLPLTIASAATWYLEAIRSRLQTRLSNLEADELPDEANRTTGDGRKSKNGLEKSARQLDTK